MPRLTTGGKAGGPAHRVLQGEGPGLSDVMYAGFDTEQAGKEIAQYLRNRNAASIGVLTDTASQPDTERFLRGFQSVYPQSSMSVHFLDCSNYQADLRAFEFYNEGCGLLTISSVRTADARGGGEGCLRLCREESDAPFHHHSAQSRGNGTGYSGV